MALSLLPHGSSRCAHGEHRLLDEALGELIGKGQRRRRPLLTAALIVPWRDPLAAQRGAEFRRPNSRCRRVRQRWLIGEGGTTGAWGTAWVQETALSCEAVLMCQHGQLDPVAGTEFGQCVGDMCLDGCL